MTGEPDARERWLLFIYRVKGESSARRTYVWRQLRELGAIYPQQAVAILPARRGIRERLEQIGQRIVSSGGEASVLDTISPTPAWEEDLVRRFNAARDAEYEEVIESVERFEDEIRRETRKRRFRFAELEEGDRDWSKLQRWIGHISDRDFFGAPGRAATDAALRRGRALLDEFTREVYRREGLSGEAQGVSS